MNNLDADLPDIVRQALSVFVEAAEKSFAQNLVSVVLYGSAAEGKLRASSDVNLILILREFKIEQVDAIRENLRMAHAAIRLSVMFLLESELPQAESAFAVKFSDIRTRHKILCGKDPFDSVMISRASVINQLQQILLNLALRLRERYALVSLRDEQLSSVVAEFVGPLRSCAASILELAGHPASNPKQALEKLTENLHVPERENILHIMSQTREETDVQAGEARQALLSMMSWAQQFLNHVQGMK